MKLPPKTSRLDLVKSGVNSLNALPKRGRFIVSIHKLVEDPTLKLDPQYISAVWIEYMGSLTSINDAADLIKV